MNLLLVANYLPPYEGGIQFVVDRLARGYTARGHQVAVTGHDAARHPERSGVPYRAVPVPAANPLERLSIPIPLFAPRALHRITGELVRWADAVHVHGLLYPNTALAVSLAARAGVPVVVTEHVGLVGTGGRVLDAAQAAAFRWAARRAGRRATAFAVLNERVAGEVGAVIGGARPVVRIDNGVDTARFRPGDRAAARARHGFTRPTALFVGRLARKKGLDLLLAAVSRSGRFDVVVCGKDTERLRDLPPTVRVLGKLDQAALAGVYRAADLLVMPSYGEGFPLVVQEAMASGLPVVACAGAVPEGGPHAAVVRLAGRDPDALAAAVHAVLDEGDAGRERLGAAARAVAVTHYDWSVAVDRYLELLDPKPAEVLS
ncbi:glycosyltransferase family 4 protein [Phytohabitans sp. ZYX-F-186]|uniref:Glycosyltransferase family 4 protein n=1 Tax=Phytohabitans maris TaxID=3071409 RepID=A0ABU0ZNC8_9ACTN|nr:glycosyltransferase family 4 protein [Phytohabitans sp. ZYX-F-186]MDQ7908539.1 glycosyltransferase family 4 protein [Phytohabitans sp. ZYX-F-186]